VSFTVEDDGYLDEAGDDSEGQIEVVPRILEEGLPVRKGSEKPKHDLDVEGDRESSLEIV